MKLLVFSALLGSALAACPNACSGHGKCGEFDSCNCYDNWMGADCSERQCMFGTAWVTTAQGDLNYDGNLNSATVYPNDQHFTDAQVDFLKTDGAIGGTWEKWPSTFPTGGEEGHYYMECSNKGVCDRKTGVCECFEGYTGQACRRTTCPEDCNGNGVCQTVGDASASYSLWDKEMSQFCKCDAGFYGISCAERKCPKGDDALTTGQFSATQFVDIHLNTNTVFGGKVSLGFTDANGKEWTTGDFTVAPHSVADTTIATAAANALNGLPNDVAKGVVVEQGFCDNGFGTFVDVATTGAATDGTSALPDTGAMRCPSLNSAAVMPLKATGQLTTDGTTAFTLAGAETDVLCYQQTSANCLRLTVKFEGLTNPGSQENLKVNVDKMTNHVSDLTKTVHTSNPFTMTQIFGDSLNLGGMGVTYKKFAADSGASVGASNVVTLSNTDNADDLALPLNQRVQINCGNKNLGTFTVASKTGATVTLAESIPTCVSATVTSVTDFITVTGNVQDLVSVGDRIKSTATGFPTKASQAVKSTSNDGINSFIVFENNEISANDFATGSVNEGSAVTDGDLIIVGTGTTEATECSDRGLCDSSTGICECFAGYNGYACNLQNAMAA